MLARVMTAAHFNLIDARRLWGTMAGMKRTFATLVLLLSLCLVGHAGEKSLAHYFAGVWYATKAPAPDLRTAGELRLWFYDDGSLVVEAHHNGGVIASGVGVWSQRDAVGVKLTAEWTLTTGEVYRYKGNFKQGFPFRNSYLGTGTYKGASWSGKWQVTGE